MGQWVALLEDDDALARTIVRRIQNALGISCERFKNTTALEEGAQREGLVAAVLDVELAGGGSGLDALAWLRTHRPVPCVLYTSLSFGDVAMRLRARDILVPPPILDKTAGAALLLDWLGTTIDGD